MNNSCTPTSTPSSFRKHSCNSNTSQSTSIEICDRKMSVQSSARPATFQLNTFKDTPSCRSNRQSRILALSHVVYTRIFLAISVCAPSRRQTTIRTVHGIVHSGIFPGSPLDRLLQFSLLCFDFFVESLSVQPAISSAEPSRVHPASLFEADPLQNASSCCSSLRISSVFSGDKKWLLFLSIVSPSLRRSSLRILISS